MIVTGWEIEDRLPAGRQHDLGDVAHDHRPARQAPQVDGLEMREQAVIALDCQHRLARGDLVAFVQRPHVHLCPAADPFAAGARSPGASAQDCDRLIDPAQNRLVLLEDLYQDPWVEVLGFEQPLRVHEVRVRVVTGPQLLERQTEDRRIEAVGYPRRHC